MCVCVCVLFLALVRYRTEFAIWCITNAPLILATDPRNMSVQMSAIVLNTELIAVNQARVFVPLFLAMCLLCL